EELRKQLQHVPEVGLDQSGAAYVLNVIRSASTPRAKGVAIPSDVGPKFYLRPNPKRADRISLPWRPGTDCELGKETAEGLHVFSTNLRSCLRASVPGKDIRPDADKLRQLLTKGENQKFDRQEPLKWNKAEAVPTIAQMLQTENTSLRLLMVEMLGKI